MAKMIRDHEGIYVAYKMKGFLDSNYHPVVKDELNSVELKPYDIDDKILIYQRQVEEWFLNRAAELCQDEKSIFVVVMITTSYIEGVQQYIDGTRSNGDSKNTFRKGIKRIFAKNNYNDYDIDTMYAQVRCGLFHDGMSREAVILSSDHPEAITFVNSTIKINVSAYFNAIKQDFSDLISKLKNPNQINLRNNFNNLYNLC